MKFRTEFTIPKSPHPISLQSRVVTLGSCFADVMGHQLKANKLAVEVNPFGTLFSPLAIGKVLELLLGSQSVDERLFVENQGRWFHYDFHSSLSAPNRSELASQLQQRIAQLQATLCQANVLILTFGTAFAYRLNEPPTYVANCHKMPGSLFTKDLLSVKDICKNMGVLYHQLMALNPTLHVIVTVSPVRHTRDGIPENSVSKAVLRAACHYLQTDFERIQYFPSYEIMMDDLRDYRFYKADLIHPNEVAEAYIAEQFAKTYFDEELLLFQKNWQEIQRDLAHRSFDVTSEAHQHFLQKLLKKLENLPQNVDISDEIAAVRRNLR
ncbi:MAG: GSCFA domain-containing protein [Spirosomataceae bacterium]